ncbi:MAG TPA: DUF393 domain-containing protein [Roseovarius sp.]
MTSPAGPGHPSAQDGGKGRTTIFYDGACPLCRAEIAHYTKRDSGDRLALVDVSQPAADLPGHLDAKSAKARFHVMSPGGHLLSGAAAFAEVWRQVPSWRIAAKIAHWPGVMPLLELAYRGFLRIRPAAVRLFLAARRQSGHRP